jgi:hypothetical protein
MLLLQLILKMEKKDEVQRPADGIKKPSAKYKEDKSESNLGKKQKKKLINK